MIEYEKIMSVRIYDPNGYFRALFYCVGSMKNIERYIRKHYSPFCDYSINETNATTKSLRDKIWGSNFVIVSRCTI